MSLEQLPDEILLIVCSYLNPFQIIQSLNDLNSRLNRTIDRYRRHIDLRCYSFHQFCWISKKIRDSFGNHVRSLVLSNAAPAVRQLVLFRKYIEPFASVLPNLQSLTLLDHYDDELDLYVPLISTLTHLTELRINFVKNHNEVMLCSLMTQMLTDNFACFDHFPKRRRHDLCKLEKLSLTGTGHLCLTPIYNETITHLTLEIEDTDDLIVIFTGFQRLHYLNVDIKQLTAFSSRLKPQCTSLLDFRFQAKWQPELLTLDEFKTILSVVPNLEHLACALRSEMSCDEFKRSAYTKKEEWYSLCAEHQALTTLDCLFKCLPGSSNGYESNFVQIIVKVCNTPDRSINIDINSNDNNVANSDSDSIVELDVQELRHMNGSQLADRLKCSHEITLYSDFLVDDDKIFSTFPESLLFSDCPMFTGIRSLDLLGEFLNMNNVFLITFVEQLIRRSPNLQSLGFFLYWVENMTDLVLDFLRPLESCLTRIRKCYIYTEGDIDERFISELAQLFPSLILFSVKVDWYCNTREVIDLCLVNMKHLIHLEMVLEDIPDYLDDEHIDRVKIDKELDSLAMSRDLHEWLKQNTLLGQPATSKPFRAEKTGNDLKIWL